MIDRETVSLESNPEKKIFAYNPLTDRITNAIKTD